VIATIRNAWKLPETRKKLLFVILALLIFRVGAAIPVPYIDTKTLGSTIAANAGSIFGLLNTMSGSAFSNATLFALSIQPYINASIIIQLLTIAIPALERLQKEGGEDGKKKIQSITRYSTFGIGLLQGFGYYVLLKSYNILTNNGIWAAIVIVMSFTAGSVFLMWLGEQITEFGVGNGISVILFTGIISRIPSMVYAMYTGLRRYFEQSAVDFTNTAVWTDAAKQAYENSIMQPWVVLMLVVGMLALVVFIVFITQAERKVPVQYAKRVVGRKVYGGQASHIPMKVNMAGVLPIIFAQTIATIPATIGMFVPASQTAGSGWNTFLKVFDTSGVIYSLVYFLLIVAFSYFYTSVQFNPVEVANNLKKNGGFIPGLRPGRPTAEFLAKALGRLTMFGAIYLAIVAILPIITGNIAGYKAMGIGGTSVIIVVGVALETVKMLEAQMLMRHYKGFLE
jgi:preprotein translocase subunit SecY